MQAAASSFHIAFGLRAGQKMLALRSTTPRQASTRQPLCVDIDGLSPNAAVRVEAHDRKRLELLCRYITRPALPDKQVRSKSAKAVLKLETGWYDGTMQSLMSSAGLMQRLAAPFNERSIPNGASRECLLCDNQSSVADVGSGLGLPPNFAVLLPIS